MKCLVDTMTESNLSSIMLQVTAESLTDCATPPILEYDRLRLLGEMKVTLAERMQEVLEAYMQYLDKEKTHFKYELEADNPGITEVIESRFANYCESVIALRKERKRKLTNGSVDQSAESQPKTPKLSGDGTLLSNYVRNEFTLGEDEIVSPMVSGVGSLRSKRTPLDEYNAMRRRSTSGVLKTTLPGPSAVTTTAVSPAVSEKSWTPLSNVPALDDVTQSSALTPPSSQTDMKFGAIEQVVVVVLDHSLHALAV
ncbi:hypothetical protein RB195_018478 [Necator americanus]|uniref:Uncharacterized protein n=1 Tax=Necator americanus TaxID=51031 RepID=A0ABR1CBX8_NECAM